MAFMIAAITASGGQATLLWVGAGITGTAFSVLGGVLLLAWWRERGRAIEFVTEKWTVYCRRRGRIELSATVDKFSSQFELSACTLQIGDTTIPLTPDPIAHPHMLVANRFIITFRANILPAEELPQAFVDASIKLRNGVKKHVKVMVPITWTD